MNQAAASINPRSRRGAWGGSAVLLVWTGTYWTRSQTDIMGDSHLFVMLSSGCVEQYGAISHSGDTGKWTREMEVEPRVIYQSDVQMASPKEKYHVLIIEVRWHIECDGWCIYKLYKNKQKNLEPLNSNLILMFLLMYEMYIWKTGLLSYNWTLGKPSFQLLPIGYCTRQGYWLVQIVACFHKAKHIWVE